MSRRARGTLGRGLRALAAGIVLILPVAQAVPGDRPLEKTLEVRVMQSGFGGLSGTLYRIEPDGAFVAKRIVAGEEDAVIRAGRMELGPMIAVAEELRAAALEKLPRELAEYTGVNPTLIEVHYGEITHRLTLPPGRAPGSGCEGLAEGAACRVLELSDQIVDAVESQE